MHRRYLTSLTLTPIARAAAFLLGASLLTACGGGNSGDGDSGTVAADQLQAIMKTNAMQSCSALSGLNIPARSIGEPSNGAVVKTAVYKTAVADAPNAANTATVPGTPDYCQVQVAIQPVDSTAPVVNMQINMPTTWMRRSVQMGGGGLNGILVTGLGPGRADGPETPLPLNRGYVTLGTDSGHVVASGVDASAFALNEEAFTNYAYAAYKKTHDVGDAIMATYYGVKATKRYYMGGSEGGREGMLMAQRYPDDFEGIVAIDPVIRLMGLWGYQATVGQVQSTPGSWLGGKVQRIHDAVRGACDAIDGISDNVVSNPMACKPLAAAALQAARCASGADEGDTCLSDAQLATVRYLYAGQTLPFSLANGLNSYPGYLYGSEGIAGAYDTWITGTVAPSTDPNAVGGGRSYNIGGGFVRFFVTKDPAFNPLLYKPENYQARIQQLSALMDMTDPDLSAFHARGGKLILRENLADKGNSPQTGIDYYNSVVARLGQAKVDEFFIAYGATGLPHTSIGVAAGAANAPSYGTPGQIDLLGLLDDWVVKSTKPADSQVLTSRAALAPYALIASKPMCRFGSYPKYTGGSPSGGNLASNYSCTTVSN